MVPASMDSGTRRRASGARHGPGRVERDGVGRVDDLGFDPEVFEDPVEQGERALDLDLDIEQLAEGEEQAALEGGECDDCAGRRRRGIAVRGERPASQYTNAGMMLKIVPMIMKNQRPTIACRIWSRARFRLIARNFAIEFSCWPNVLDSSMPDTLRVSSVVA